MSDGAGEGGIGGGIDIVGTTVDQAGTRSTVGGDGGSTSGVGGICGTIYLRSFDGVTAGTGTIDGSGGGGATAGLTGGIWIDGLDVTSDQAP